MKNLIRASDLTRRRFLRSSAATGVALSYAKMNTRAAEPSDTIRVALIGCGSQGMVLAGAMARIPGIKIHAVVDCWPVKRQTAARNFVVDGFETTEELLAKKGSEIDACVIATPDWLHEPISTLCLKAGKAVYCEKMMSNSIEAAKKMVQSQKETGKLFAIGHQRRSNPRYRQLRDVLLRQENLPGHVTHLYGQWNRSVKPPLRPKQTIPDEKLKGTLGYENWFEFCNWRWFKKYGGGPISDLGAHQIDIFNWLLGTTPKSVTAGGGVDYYKNRKLHPMIDGDNPEITYELLDNAIAIYEYETEQWGTVRAVYQVLTTTGSQAYYEKIMGTEASILISEDPNVKEIYPEKDTFVEARWEQLYADGKLGKPSGPRKFWENPRPWHQDDKWKAGGGPLDVRASKARDPYYLPELSPEIAAKPYHQHHLENFFTTVRNGGSQADLNCPVEDAYKSCVTVLKINESVATGQKYVFKPEDFAV